MAKKMKPGTVLSRSDEVPTAYKPFAVFDIDGTLIRWQLYHAIADALAHRGHIEPKSYQAMRQARLAWKKRSGGTFKDYEAQVIAIYEAVLKTLSFRQLDEAIDAVFDEYKSQVYVYTRELVKQLKAEGYLLFAISGSQTEIVAKIAAFYGFDDYVGTIYERRKDRFTGKPSSIGSFHKDQTLRKLVAKHDLDFGGSIAVGDSHSDIAMLELVERPIAFNPEDSLFKHAVERGWEVVVERKNVIYKLEKQDGRYCLAKTE